MHGVPSSALLGDPRYASGGCYGSSARNRDCPSRELRDVYFGLLGPDATSISPRSPAGGSTQSSTASPPDGAYLLCCRTPNGAADVGCRLLRRARLHYSPQLETNEAIMAVAYRARPAMPAASPPNAQTPRRGRSERARDAVAHAPRHLSAPVSARDRPRARSANLSRRQLAAQAVRPRSREAKCAALGYVPLATSRAGLRGGAREPGDGQPEASAPVLEHHDSGPANIACRRLPR